MGICDCSKSPAPTLYLDKFWESLPIRQKTVKDTVQMIKAKKNIADEDLNEKKLDLIIENLLLSQNYKESQKIFRKAHKLSISEYSSENYFLLSLLFLCKNASNIEFMEGFIELYNYFKSLGNIEKPEEGSPLIKKDILTNIVNFYVNLVTLFTVNELDEVEGTKFNNSNSNKNSLNNIFTKERQENYINEMIMQGFSDEENIDLLEFFHTNLDKLESDAQIRESIVGDYENYIKQKSKKI